MKEIGALEDRIRKLEYYTVLNALALDTKTTSIQNDQGIERFKNGIFADPFNDDTIMNTQSPELNIGISSRLSLARPNFYEKFIGFELDKTTSTNVKVSGRLLTLDYTNVKLGGNPHATTVRNCAETFYSFKGALQIYPNFDNTNVNTQAADQTIVNDQAKAFSDAAAAGAFKDIDTTYSNPKIVDKKGNTNYWQSNTTITIRDIKVEAQKQPPQDLGDFVKDVSLMPYMVGRKLAIIASHMKPNTKVYPFFDKKSVSAQCSPARVNPVLLAPNGTVDAEKWHAATFSADASSVLQQQGQFGDQLVTNDKGNLNLIFNLPSNTFRSGERIFMLIDQDDVTATSAVLTSAEGVYNSSSLSTTKQKLKYQVIEPKFTPTTYDQEGKPLTWETKDPPPVRITTGTDSTHDTGGTGTTTGTNPNSCGGPPDTTGSTTGSTTGVNTSTRGDCHVPWANILMADGSFKQIKDIVIGDAVMGMSGINYVTYVGTPNLDSRLVSFNNVDYFVSETHPMITTKGWGAFNPELLRQQKPQEYNNVKSDNNDEDLVVIDENSLVGYLDKTGEIKYVPVENIKYESRENYTVYRLSVTGDRTYVAEGYIAHNK